MTLTTKMDLHQHSSYTHNLKIILFDNDNNIVLDNDFMDEIKNKLCQINTKDVTWNMHNLKTTIQWNKIKLNKVDEQFMGDLFLKSIYDIDSIMVNHTTQVISSVNNKTNYKVKFYISRLIGNKQVCSNSFGIL